jgi:hypothetical protein
VSVLAWLVLDAGPAPKPIDKSRVEPGWIGLVFLVVLGGVVAFLWFSMRKQLGRIDVGRHLRERGSVPPPVAGNGGPPAAGSWGPPAGGGAPPPAAGGVPPAAPSPPRDI